jgi:hypothetical protein
MGPTALLPLRRKWCYGFLSPLKIHRPRPGLNPRTLGPVASTRPPRTPPTCCGTCEDSLLCSQEPTTGPCPELDESNPHTKYFVKIHFSKIIPYTRRSPKWPLLRVRWVPCQHGMAVPQDAYEGRRSSDIEVAANMLNKQSRTADKWWSCILENGQGASNPSP